MHFGPNECVICGHVRGPFTSKHITASDGVVYRLEEYECGFCSDACIERAIRPYSTGDFAFYKDSMDDPRIRVMLKNYENIQKQINDGSLRSNEEMKELQDALKDHKEMLIEVAKIWDDAQHENICAAMESFIVQWARDCNAYHARVLEKKLAEKKREIEREEKEEEAQHKRDLLELQKKRRELEREAAGLERELRYKEQQQERLRKEQERKAEAEQRDRDKAYERAEADHADFLKQEALQDALAFKPIPDRFRTHTAAIAKTGWGKTQLLQSLVLDELKKPDPPSIIVLDSTGQMVNTLQHLAVFNSRLRDRLIVIDPAHSPALNMFDISSPRFVAYTDQQREDIQTELVTLFKYVFASKDYDLSGQMGLAFPYAVRLILNRRGSTISDLRRLLEENPPKGDWQQSAFANDIRALDPDAIEFFANHFFSDSLRATRAAVARRIHLIIAVPAFRRMFISSSNMLDFYTETQENGSIILVNTNENLLKDEYILFGRYIIARLVSSIYERANIPIEERRTTHLIIDETGPYLDDSFDTLLTRVRQFGLKVTLAFQHYMQLSEKLQNTVAGQTSVKYVGGMSYKDARVLASNMRCTPEFLTDQLCKDTAEKPSWAQFAVSVDNMTRVHPMLLTLPFYAAEDAPKMSVTDHARLIQRMKARFARPQTHEAPTTDASRAPAPSQPNTNNFSVSPEPKRTAALDEPSEKASAASDHDDLINPNVGDHTEPASNWGDRKKFP